MKDPVAGLREMARVTRPGGVVAACVWDHAGERSPIAVFWRAARELDPAPMTSPGWRARTKAHSRRCCTRPACATSRRPSTRRRSRHATFEEWWEPFTLGVGPAGQYAAGLDEDPRAALRERCRALLPDAPPAVAWSARGIVT